VVKAVHIYTAVAWIAGARRHPDRRGPPQRPATIREIDGFDADDVAWLRRSAAPRGA